MFNLFGNKNYFVGIDFGTSAVKMVELFIKDEKINLSNYGWIDLGFISNHASNDPASNSGVRNEKIKFLLKKLVEKMKLKSKSAYASIPGFSGLITVAELPIMKDSELEGAIQFEARKHIPVSLDEVAIDWEIIKREEQNNTLQKPDQKISGDGKMLVLLVIASKKDIIDSTGIIESSGLSVQSVELETFSLVRSLIGEDSGTFLIVDIGSRATNIILAEKGFIKVNRNIDFGGSEISKFIAESMKISIQRADSLKKERKDILGTNGSSTVIPALEMVSNEAKRIINAYKEKNVGARIEGVILSGGSAKLAGIDNYFSQSLGVKAFLGNPWKRIYYDAKLEEIVRGLGTSYSAAIGLALRGAEEYKRK